MLHQELMREDKVQKALKALGDEGEEINLAFTTKQVTDRSEKRVYAGLTFRALYLFEKDHGSHYLRCRERVDIVELVGVSIAKGGVEMALRSQNSADNVVLRFTRKNESGKRDAEVLLEEIRILHEDLKGKELPLTHENLTELKSFLSKESRSKDRTANLSTRIARCCERSHSEDGTEASYRARLESQEDQVSDLPPKSSKAPGKGALTKTPSFADIMAGKTKLLPGRSAATEKKGMDGAAAAAVREIQDCLNAIQGAHGATLKSGVSFGAGSEIGQALLSEEGMDPDMVVDKWVTLGLKGQLPHALSLPGLGHRQEMAGKELCDQVYKSYPQFIQAAGAASSIDTELASLSANLRSTANLLAHLEELPTTSRARLQATEEEEGHVGGKGIRLGGGAGGGWRQRSGRGLREEVDERVQNLFDEIDAKLVEHKHEQAVEQVEEGWALAEEGEEEEGEEGSSGGEGRKRRGKKLPAAQRRLLAQGIKQRAHTLVDAIWHQVQNNPTQPVEHPVSLLLRLRSPQNAVQMLLSSRTGFWEREVASIQARADAVLTQSVVRVCKLTFSCILQTAQDFRKLFPERDQLPSLLAWSSALLALFVTVFSSEVFVSEDLSVVGDCVHAAKEHCRQLSKQGLSLESQLDLALLPPLARLITASFTRIREAVQPLVSRESWRARRVDLSSLQTLSDHSEGALRGRAVAEEPEETVCLTDSAQRLYTRAYRLVHVIREEAGMDLGGDLGERLVGDLEDLLLWYTSELAPAAQKLDPLSPQTLSILGNLEHLISPLLPSLFPPSLPSNAKPFTGSSTAQRDLMWAKIRDAKTKEVVETLQWSSVDYSRSTINTASAKPSERMQRMMAQVSTLGEMAGQYLGEERAKELLRQVLQGVLEATLCAEKRFWQRYLPQDQPCGFGQGGLQQLVLDLRFLLNACAGFAPPHSRLHNTLKENLERAVVGYCMAMDEERGDVLEGEAWHDNVIRKTLLAMSSITKGLFIAGYDRS